jgi:hypothetical protein
MIVKTIGATQSRDGFTPYQWYEMSFLSTFSNQRNLLLCFDVPEFLTNGMLDVLSGGDHSNAAAGPYGLHQPLLEQLMTLYDKSVWDIARIMRNNEQSKGPSGNTDLQYFLKLYEDSRHTVHSIETTQEAAKVYERIAQHCESLILRAGNHQDVLSTRSEMLRFHHTMMQGLVARAISNDRRMGNEQNLTSNLMTQLDNKTNVEIAMAAKDDSASMKAIAIVTMTFLPATFVSALLGMNFFAYDPDAHGGHVTYSPDLWMYFVISIMLTLLCFAMYWLWERSRVKAMAKSRRENDRVMHNAYSILGETANVPLYEISRPPRARFWSGRRGTNG